MEKKLHKKIKQILNSEHIFVYHIKDVPDTGARVCDFIVCNKGKFIAIEAKVIKKKIENFEKDIQSAIEKRLTSSQQAYRLKLLKSGANYLVYAFVYDDEGIDITSTNGILYIVSYELENGDIKCKVSLKSGLKL